MARVTKTQIEYAQKRLNEAYSAKISELQKFENNWVPPNHPTYEDIVKWMGEYMDVRDDALERLQNHRWSVNVMSEILNCLIDFEDVDRHMYKHNGYWTVKGEAEKKKLEKAYNQSCDMIMLGDQEQVLKALDNFKDNA